jgi:hypothetical protein
VERTSYADAALLLLVRIAHAQEEFVGIHPVQDLSSIGFTAGRRSSRNGQRWRTLGWSRTK